MNQESELLDPYYNNDFKIKIKKFLESLSYVNIEFAGDGISWSTVEGQEESALINKNVISISDFIDSCGYQAEDFSIYGTVIFYPNY